MSFLRQNRVFARNRGHFIGNSTNYLANIQANQGFATDEVLFL